jgi:N-acetylmuramoyl-L-alanine amidase-like protein
MVQIIEDTDGKIRDKPINNKLRRVLIRAGDAAGIDIIRVTSGGQAKKGSRGKRTGSTRHDLGNAADLQLIANGRALDFTSPGDRPIVAAFVTAAAANGATGIGAGVEYMGPKTLHVGFGSRQIWGKGGKARYAPEWLKRAVRTGWANPAPVLAARFASNVMAPAGDYPEDCEQPVASWYDDGLDEDAAIGDLDRVDIYEPQYSGRFASDEDEGGEEEYWEEEEEEEGGDLEPTPSLDTFAAQALWTGSEDPDAEERSAMAQQIVDFEARRDAKGRLRIYKLPSGDGGGAYEIAGINVRYHPREARELAALIRAGKYKKAERRAVSFIKEYTDAAKNWTSNLGVESYLRDTIFNRGPGGAAWILQKSVGVPTDRKVGPVTLQAVRLAEQEPLTLLQDLRQARETYERRVVGRNEQSKFWRGLVNRWNKALSFAVRFIDDDDAVPVTARLAASVSRPAFSEFNKEGEADDEGIEGSEDFDAQDVESTVTDLCRAELFENQLNVAAAPAKPDAITKYTTKHHYSRKGHDISHIVMHYTYSDNYMSAVRTFEKPYWNKQLKKWIRTSAHYIIGRRGELVQMVGDDRAAWHAGSRSTNYKSIGIEHAAAPGKKLTQAQSNKSIELIRWLMYTYDIPRENIIGHKCVKGTSCPGDLFADYGANSKSGCNKVSEAVQAWLTENSL